MSKFPLYDTLSDIKEEIEDDDMGAKRIADTMSQIRDIDYDEYVKVQKIIYCLIYHYDRLMNGNKNPNMIPFGGKLVSEKPRMGVVYKNFSNFDPHLKLVIYNLIKVIETKLIL